MKRVADLKEVRDEGWRAEVRMMNCIKMYGGNWTTLSVLVVRDHTSKGVPTMFWKHNLRKQKNMRKWSGRFLTTAKKLSLDVY